MNILITISILIPALLGVTLSKINEKIPTNKYRSHSKLLNTNKIWPEK